MICKFFIRITHTDYTEITLRWRAWALHRHFSSIYILKIQLISYIFVMQSTTAGGPWISAKWLSVAPGMAPGHAK